MKALVKRYAEPGLWMEEVPMPQVGVNDVLIKVTKAAICGTDLHMYKWDEWSQSHCTPPYIMGHEFVGVAVEVGPGVRGVKVGDRVTAEGHINHHQRMFCGSHHSFGQEDHVFHRDRQCVSVATYDIRCAITHQYHLYTRFVQQTS